MRITSKKYDKMMAEFDADTFPRVKSEMCDDSGRCFKNQSEPSKDRLVANRPGSKSLEYALDLFED